ncbi:kelch domain-containing protein 10 [Patella vulgata]|uniref:kelch domain-containing protein 10 n=1 Tax=Patella vulgata TaxID=6465 RepID=UPI00218078A6|nr:kelch domain-containing protein 10 [Patella vulgata]
MKNICKFGEVLPKNIKTHEIPEERSGHRLVVDEANLYALGGYNPEFWEIQNDEDSNYPLFHELWKFNFATRKWKRLKTQGRMPFELASHTIVKDRSNILLFGGTGIPFGDASSNELNVCDLKTLKWKYYPCTGELPEAKYGHTMTLVGDYVYVIGGTTGLIYNMDVHQLNLNDLRWEQLSGQDNTKWQPDSRYRHEVISKGNDLYLIGGGTALEVFGFKEIPVFNIQTLKWKEFKGKPDSINGYPSARRCHSCVYFDNEIYICGGLGQRRIADDIWKLNLTTLQWKKLPCLLPSPVYFHSADVTQNGCMYVFGGVVHIEDKRSNKIYRIWLKLPPLAELCWNILCDEVKDWTVWTKHHLLELGIPSHYIDRIDNL